MMFVMISNLCVAALATESLPIEPNNLAQTFIRSAAIGSDGEVALDLDIAAGSGGGGGVAGGGSIESAPFTQEVSGARCGNWNGGRIWKADVPTKEKCYSICKADRSSSCAEFSFGKESGSSRTHCLYMKSGKACDTKDKGGQYNTYKVREVAPPQFTPEINGGRCGNWNGGRIWKADVPTPDQCYNICKADASSSCAEFSFGRESGSSRTHCLYMKSGKACDTKDKAGQYTTFKVIESAPQFTKEVDGGRCGNWNGGRIWKADVPTPEQCYNICKADRSSSCAEFSFGKESGSSRTHCLYMRSGKACDTKDKAGQYTTYKVE